MLCHDIVKSAPAHSLPAGTLAAVAFLAIIFLLEHSRRASGEGFAVAGLERLYGVVWLFETWEFPGWLVAVLLSAVFVVFAGYSHLVQAIEAFGTAPTEQNPQARRR